MRARHSGRDRIVLEFSNAECVLLASLTDELLALLDERDTVPPGMPSDPAVLRLLPDAYRQDAEAAAEFRRFTQDELITAKRADARAIADAARAGNEVALDRASAIPWLRSLTDLRLVLADRLGIQNDGDEGDDSPEAEPAQQVYLWLGNLQGWILETLQH
ncbi:MAG: DUF2017 family protein [Microbacteriaceae bacterium]|nr:MAG: DUF2017 family protein [Microbacteriaceae bacterium]